MSPDVELYLPLPELSGGQGDLVALLIALPDPGDPPLPEQEQNSLATIILKELAAERRWEKAFAGSEDALAELADEALNEFREGRSPVFDPDEL